MNGSRIYLFLPFTYKIWYCKSPVLFFFFRKQYGPDFLYSSEYLERNLPNFPRPLLKSSFCVSWCLCDLMWYTCGGQKISLGWLISSVHPVGAGYCIQVISCASGPFIGWTLTLAQYFHDYPFLSKNSLQHLLFIRVFMFFSKL